MSDDDLTSAHELASAYLDEQLDDAARARVEADPTLMAQVESFRQLRTQLADVPPAAAEARDGALAAALAEFDALRAPVPAAAGNTGSSSNIVSLDARRFRLTRLVGAVAAGVAVVGIGIGVVSSLQHQSSSTATKGGSDASATVTGAPMPASTIGDITGPAVALPTLTDAQQLLAVGEQPGVGGANSQVESTSDSGGVSAATTAGTTAGTFAGVTPPVGDSERAAFRCPLTEHQRFVAEIVWKTTPAVVVRDTVTGVVQAIDDQCTVLAEATP